MRISHTLRLSSVALCMCALFSSCDKIDENVIPDFPVQIVFTDVGMWHKYGIAGALDYRMFIRQTKQPEGFFYTATTYTGYGGVLLVGDIYSNPQAYDLSCPVERSPDIRVYIDNQSHQAVCPKCGSRFDVFENYGYPIQGPAAEKKFGLSRYNVYQGTGTNYMVIAR